LFDLIDFLLEKETGLYIRIRHTVDNKYILTLETSLILENRYKNYDNLFTKVGMNEPKGFAEDKYCYEWKNEYTTSDELLTDMRYIVNYIITEYSLEPETSENNIVSFILLARLNKRTLSKK